MRRNHCHCRRGRCHPAYQCVRWRRARSTAMRFRWSCILVRPPLYEWHIPNCFRFVAVTISFLCCDTSGCSYRKRRCSNLLDCRSLYRRLCRIVVGPRSSLATSRHLYASMEIVHAQMPKEVLLKDVPELAHHIFVIRLVKDRLPGDDAQRPLRYVSSRRLPQQSATSSTTTSPVSC